MKIVSIDIANVRGIEDQKFELDLFPNKPNLLVAPNGFGKSSIATAFASMNRNRMALDENDCFQCDSLNKPKLTLIVESDSHQKKTLFADCEHNGIHAAFDIIVIRSGLIPKATKHNMGSFTPVSASLEIQSIPICKVPEKVAFVYKYSDAKSEFGENGKVLPNITEQLKNANICEAINECDFDIFFGKRIQRQIDGIKERINSQTGSSNSICEWIGDNLIDDLRSINSLSMLAQRMADFYEFDSETESYLAALQVVGIYLSDKNGFKNAVEWLRYTETKKDYENLLKGFCSSKWQWARVVEFGAKKTTKELQIVFPPAHQLSNGQRDIVTLVIQMHKALFSRAKKPLILVIDEVFDYLDDANLVAFQYYVTNLIEKYKNLDLVLFPLILTHLDPGVFFDFCFNKHKIQTHYLKPHSSGKSKDSLTLIRVREENNKIKEQLEKHWFHFHPKNCVIDTAEWPNGLCVDWRESDNFHAYANTELQRYLNDKNYDPLAVCFAIRITIEKNTYFLLDGQSKASFINTHKTKEKLQYAAERVDDMPETFFLLGLIYNTSLHWQQGRDYISPLVAKLNHPVIKNLIIEATK